MGNENEMKKFNGHVYFVSYGWPDREVYKVAKRWLDDDEDCIRATFVSDIVDPDIGNLDPDVFLEACRVLEGQHNSLSPAEEHWAKDFFINDTRVTGPWMFVNAIYDGQEVSGFLRLLSQKNMVGVYLLRGEEHV